MAAATVTVVESNTVGETPTAITYSYLSGTRDVANIGSGGVPAITADAIAAGSYSYEKYQRLYIVNASGNTLKNFKVWGSADPTPDVVKTSAKTSAYTAPSFATPVTTASSKAVNALAYAEPACNFGYGGVLNADCTGTAVYSDYVCWQLKVDATTVAGKTWTLYYQYDEYA